MDGENARRIIDTISLPDGLRQLSTSELEVVCKEIRELLVGTVSRSGGHLASSLGAVELTVALHTVLDSPHDKIIWDVGHQAYVHKILTGRKDHLHTIRQFGGISGFPKREESPHDIFGTGHASTSISAALGIARARDMKKERYAVVSVIGDGSMSGGLAFEAINNVRDTLKGNFVVILNDNGMSISDPVGALSNVITTIRTSSAYLRLKNKIEGVIGRIPKIGTPLTKKIETLVDRTKNLVTDFKVGVIFEELGFRYLGPIDGHNIPLLMMAISYARQTSQPVFIHIITQKGKGYLPAEKDPVTFHGINPFNVESGKIEPTPQNPSFTSVYGRTLSKIAEQDERICAITAAMPDGTGLFDFKDTFPNRFFDVGIAEEHAVTFAAGLATEGFRPFVSIYSTFMQRAYDQVIHDVCLQKLPVVFALDRGGLVGEDGPTHHGAFDYAFMRHIPHLVVMAPKDQNELVDMIYTAHAHNGPVSIRYPRGQGTIETVKEDYALLPIGKAELVLEKQGNFPRTICLVAIGSMVETAVEVAEKLYFSRINTIVINGRFVKPLDEELIVRCAQTADLVVTLEEGTVAGGFGSAVLELLGRTGISCGTLCIGLPDVFVEHGSRKQLFEKYQLDTAGVLQQINARLGSSRGCGNVIHSGQGRDTIAS